MNAMDKALAYVNEIMKMERPDIAGIICMLIEGLAKQEGMSVQEQAEEIMDTIKLVAAWKEMEEGNGNDI